MSVYAGGSPSFSYWGCLACQLDWGLRAPAPAVVSTPPHHHHHHARRGWPSSWTTTQIAASTPPTHLATCCTFFECTLAAAFLRLGLVQANADADGVSGGTTWHAAGYVTAGLSILGAQPTRRNTMFERIAGTPSLWEPTVHALLHVDDDGPGPGPVCSARARPRRVKGKKRVATAPGGRWSHTGVIKQPCELPHRLGPARPRGRFA